VTPFWDAITGRTRPKKADLDSLFLVPSADSYRVGLGVLPRG
jgi:hypothetical protein